MKDAQESSYSGGRSGSRQMKTECSFCGQHYEIPIEYNGRTAECTSCGKTFVIAPRSSHLLDGLNPEQVDAVTSPEGYVRVIAGAGTGKTRVLTRRLAYLIEELHIPPDEVLSVTFTNKAAREMNYRIRRLLGNSVRSRVSTFHGFCNTVLREDIPHLFYPSNFTIMNEGDQKLLLREIYLEMGLSSRDFSYKEVKAAISLFKKDFGYVASVISPDASELNRNISDDTITQIILSYLWKQRKNYLLDYDDLIQLTLYLFTNNADIREKWQERLHYIQVDEFQDVNASQYELVKILSQKHGNLFVVGDPDQTIYEWRGANVRFFLDFPAEKTVLLHRNYRSTPEILNTSNNLISHNKDHIENPLDALKQSGAVPVFFVADRDHSESDWIAERLLEQQGKRSYSDCAILCRSLFLTRKIEESLVRKKIPYHIYNGTDFYQRQEIQDALCYLRLVDGNDNLAFLRIINIPRRGMGKKRISILKEIAEENGVSLFEALSAHATDRMFCQCMSFVSMIQDIRKQASAGMTISELLNNVLKESGYEASIMFEGDQDRKNNLEELKQSVYNLEKEAEAPIPLHDYLAQIALYSEREDDQDRDSVKIMTIHTAKGLEFPCVFVAGLNEGTLPNSHAFRPEDVEQERRVAYVAFTRAEDELFLSSDNPDQFNFSGEKMELSRFVNEVYKTIKIKESDEVKFRVSGTTEYYDRSSRARELNAQPGNPLTDGATDLTGCDDVGIYDFAGKRVCITGKFAISRAELKKRLTAAGAEVVDSVTWQLDALLVGGAASAGWSGGNFGNKMAAAAMIRQYSETPLLLTEETVMRNLGEEGQNELF